jgi:tetratricopeptide (TPR) repeat protein/tRNA A-37 threonylcarbamoyl transferase component Bud32
VSPTGPAFPTFAAGDLLAQRFRVVGFLGAGAVGEVYEAEDEALGGRVAIKALRPELVADADAVARLHREVHLTRVVTHPNVCRTYDGFVDAAGRPFLTMELLDGEPLDAHLERCGRLPPAEALDVLRQIADGLAAAHAAGVVHRDLKTGNVFLVGEGDERRVVVTDFGLAHSALASSASISRTGELVGSPAYMAPEQVRGEPVGPATDVYALGIVAYELVTGELPFRGESGFVTAIKRLTEPPPPPRRLVPELPPVWDEAVLRCLAADPSDRFADPRELPRALARTAGEERAAIGGRIRPGPAKEPSPLRRRLAGAAAAGLVLAAVAGASGWTAWRSERAPEAEASASAVGPGAVAGGGPQGARGAARVPRPQPPAGGAGHAAPPAGKAPVAHDPAAAPDPAAEAPSAQAIEGTAAARPAGPPSDPTDSSTPPGGAPASVEPAAAISAAAGNEHFRGGRIAEARAAYEEALAAWPPGGDPAGRAGLINNLGNTFAIEGRLEEATPYYRESLAMRRRLDDQSQVSRALEGLGRHLFSLGDLVEARRSFEEALVLARRGGREGEAARLLVNLAAVLRQAGDHEQAERVLRAAVDLYRELDVPVRVAATERTLGDLLRLRGRLSEAVGLLERALAAALEHGDQAGEAAARGTLARTLHALGRPGAEESLAQSEELWRARSSRAARARTAINAAAWSLEAGATAAARARLAPALAELEEIGGSQGLHEALGVLSDLHRQEGDGEAARAAAERSLALARQLGLPVAQAHGLLRLARLALDDGMPVEAIALARSAAVDLESAGWIDDARLAGLLLAESRLASGDAAGARRDLAASGAAGSEAVRVRWRAELLAARLAVAAGEPAAAELARLEAEASRRGWRPFADEAAAAAAAVELAAR